MKFKRFFSGYTELFSFLSRVVVLFLLCFGISVGVVYPLWNFAVSAPQIYTGVVVTGFASFLLLVTILKIRSYIITSIDSTEKKARIKTLFFSFLKTVLILSSLSFSLYSLYNGNRLWAMGILLIAFFFYGIISFASKKD